MLENTFGKNKTRKLRIVEMERQAERKNERMIISGIKVRPLDARQKGKER